MNFFKAVFVAVITILNLSALLILGPVFGPVKYFENMSLDMITVDAILGAFKSIFASFPSAGLFIMAILIAIAAIICAITSMYGYEETREKRFFYGAFSIPITMLVGSFAGFAGGLV